MKNLFFISCCALLAISSQLSVISSCNAASGDDRRNLYAPRVGTNINTVMPAPQSSAGTALQSTSVVQPAAQVIAPIAATDDTAQLQSRMDAAQAELSDLDSKIAADKKELADCEKDVKQKKLWTGLTIAGAVGTVATGTGAIIQANQISKEHTQLNNLNNELGK